MVFIDHRYFVLRAGDVSDTLATLYTNYQYTKRSITS